MLLAIVLNHYHFDLFFALYFFFALHLILSSYFDVVDTRIRPSNVVNTRYSVSPSNFP